MSVPYTFASAKQALPLSELDDNFTYLDNQSGANTPYTPAGTGAVTTTLQKKAQERVSLFDFMTAAQIADVQAGTLTLDVTTAVQAAITYAYSLAPATGWRAFTSKLWAPRGKYRIATPDVLFSGCNAGRFDIEGDGGYGATQFVYDVASPISSNYMIKNNDLIGFCTFSNIYFLCKNITSNQQFMYYYSTGTAQNLQFNRCMFDSFSTLFDVQGAANASENTFIGCKFWNISGAHFKMNNVQSLNWWFYACNAEGFSGILFDVYKGFQAFWYGGSIEPGASTGRIVRVPLTADSSTFSQDNAPHVSFIGARFEMAYGALQTEKLNSACNVNLVYDMCGMGGEQIPAPASSHKQFNWSGNGQITIRNCGALTNYLFDVTADGSLGSGVLNVYIDKCPTLSYTVITASNYTVASASYNYGAAPVFTVTGCNNTVDGVYRPNDSQLMSSALIPTWNNPTNIAQQKRALCFRAEVNTFALVTGGTYTVRTPPVRISGFELWPVVNGGTAGYSVTITIKNAAGTTLGAFSAYDPASSTTKQTKDINYFVDAVAGDYLQIVITYTGSGPSPFLMGNLYVTY